MQAVQTDTLELSVSDVTKQKRARVGGVAPDASVGELVQALLDELKLPQADVEGRSLSYHALLERESRHLHATERIGDVLQPGDSLTLQPNIDAA